MRLLNLFLLSSASTDREWYSSVLTGLVSLYSWLSLHVFWSWNTDLRCDGDGVKKELTI